MGGGERETTVFLGEEGISRGIQPFLEGGHGDHRSLRGLGGPALYLDEGVSAPARPSLLCVAHFPKSDQRSVLVV